MTNTCSNGEATHFALYGKVLSELAYNGSDTSGLENPLGRWMGQASRFAPLLSARMRKALGGPIQTIAPAFDGLQVFPSLVGFCLTTSPHFGRCLHFRLASRRCLSPPDIPHLPHSQEGYGVVIETEMSGYLGETGHPTGHLTDDILTIIWAIRGGVFRRASSESYFRAKKPTNIKLLQIGLISRNPT
jgi:hypothetical protein